MRGRNLGQTQGSVVAFYQTHIPGVHTLPLKKAEQIIGQGIFAQTTHDADAQPQSRQSDGDVCAGSSQASRKVLNLGERTIMLDRI
jgi:hypothetical protein